MIKKLEKCIKRYINDYLTKDWYDEEEFGDKINEIIEYLSTQEKLGILVDNTGKEPSKKVQETSDINLSEYNPFTMLKGMISEKYGNMYRDINDFINNIEKDYISKEKLKEWIEKGYGTTFYGSIHQVILNKLIEHFNL